MPTNSNVLLTGASGAVGHEVLRQLHSSGKYNITVFDLKSSAAVKLFKKYKSEIEVIYGDISKKEDIKSACQEKDIVIHLAAVIPPLADEQPKLAYSVNVTGTENLISALENYSPGAFLIYSSSISVYGDRVADPNIKLSDPLTPSPRDEYALTKIEAEKLIKQSVLDWTIFRLCAIMGRHKISKLMFHQPLNTSFEIATLEDSARAFVHAIEHQAELSKKTFNLGGGASCRTIYDEFLKRSFDIAGLGKFEFAPKSFAEKNFHCGFYADGDALEEILHFRKDTIDSYYEKEQTKVPAALKLLVSLLNRPIKRYLQNLSEPLRAVKTNDTKDIQHYFYDRKVGQSASE